VQSFVLPSADNLDRHFSSSNTLSSDHLAVLSSLLYHGIINLVHLHFDIHLNLLVIIFLGLLLVSLLQFIPKGVVDITDSLQM
jgi:hypothetical protein